MVKNYNEIISSESENTLRKIIGESLFKIYSPYIEVEDNVITSSSFSIEINGEWINFSNSWKETTNNIDYYKFQIELDSTPKDIKFNKEKNTLEHPVSSILFNRGAKEKQIEKIEIYSKNQVWGSEKITYDHAVVFYPKNDFRICINVLEQVTDQLECIINDNLIYSLISGSNLRMVIQ